MTRNLETRFLRPPTFLRSHLAVLLLGQHLLRPTHAGPDAEAEALGPEVPPVAGPAVEKVVNVTKY